MEQYPDRAGARMKPARYTLSSGSLANNVWTAVNYDEKDYDDDNLVTTGVSWQFLSPEDGYYSFVASITMASLLWSDASGWSLGLGLYLDTGGGWTPEKFMMRYQPQFTRTKRVRIQGSIDAYLSLGDKAQIRAFRFGVAGSQNYEADSKYNYVAISKVQES